VGGSKKPYVIFKWSLLCIAYLGYSK
jgi:hypothetical protein